LVNKEINTTRKRVYYFLAVFTGDKDTGVMTQKTFIFTRQLLMLASVTLSLALVLLLHMHF
jgi:hypothetical protein